MRDVGKKLLSAHRASSRRAGTHLFSDLYAELWDIVPSAEENALSFCFIKHFFVYNLFINLRKIIGVVMFDFKSS